MHNFSRKIQKYPLIPIFLVSACPNDQINVTNEEEKLTDTPTDIQVDTQPPKNKRIINNQTKVKTDYQTNQPSK